MGAASKPATRTPLEAAAEAFMEATRETAAAAREGVEGAIVTSANSSPEDKVGVSMRSADEKAANAYVTGSARDAVGTVVEADVMEVFGRGGTAATGAVLGIVMVDAGLYINSVECTEPEVCVETEVKDEISCLSL